MTDYLDDILDFTDPRVSDIFDEVSFWSSRFGAILLDNVEIRPRTRILDLGTGNGFPLFELAHRCGGSAFVVGIEPWPSCRERLRRKLQVHSLPRAAVAWADGGRLPFADASFELVVSNVGVNNFADPPGVLAECRRALLPGGRIAITTNVTGHMRELYAVLREVLAETGHAASVEKLLVQERRRSSRYGLTKLFEQAGFSVSRTGQETFPLRYLDGSALLRHPLTRAGFLDGWRSVIDPPHQHRVFAALEDRLNEIAARQGELRMTVPMLYLEARKV